VGQGVPYRHFPTRPDLARAVFAENDPALADRVVKDALRLLPSLPAAVTRD
jgi:hypothetical protein